MTSTSYRFPVIILTLGVAFVTIGTRLTGQLYPVLPATMALALVCLLAVQFTHQEFSIQYLGGYIALSVFYRTFAYLYPPSFIGADSDGFAFYIARLLLGNHFSSIPSRFYSGAPGFFLTGEATTIMTGGSIKIGLLFPAIIAGIVFPIAAFVLPRYLPITNSKPVQFLAAAITVMAPTSVALTSNPVPQVQSTVLTFTCVISLAIYIRYRNNFLIFIFIICISIILFTHKLAPYTVMSSLLLASGLGVFHRTNRVSIINRVFGFLGLALALGAYLQVVFTNFDRSLIARLFLLDAEGEKKTSTEVVTSIAEPTLSPILSLLFNIGYQIPLFGLAGLGWLVLLQRGYEHTFTRFVLVFTALNTGLTIGATFGIVSSGAFRFILPIIPLLAILVAICLVVLVEYNHSYTTLSLSRVARIGLAIFILALLVGGQTVSLTASSDSTLEPRAYLTNSELTAKEWMDNYISRHVLTDDFYANEIGPSKIRQYARQNRVPPIKYRGMNKRIINGTLTNNPDCFVALRPDVRRYSYNGRWQLMGSVTQGFITAHMTYSSGSSGVNVFWQRNCSSNL